MGGIQSTRRKPTTFGRALTDSFHKCVHREDRTHELRGESACSDDFNNVLHSIELQVRKGDDSCRGIVFVKMRKTCTKLCDAINEDPLICRYLNPKKFVGHGKGTHGMEWKAEQEPVLKEFHLGECKLLVSTSVLEEGLDVPACNLVIRFDSVLNMRALIQSRGRAARRPDSRFVIMCNDRSEVGVAYKQ